MPQKAFYFNLSDSISMKIAIAIDSFKDGASNSEINLILKQQLHIDDIDIQYYKMGDGGEGTLQALADTIVDVQTIDALMRPITCQIGFLDNGHTCVVEMAQCVGLQRLQLNERNAIYTSTYGFGQIIRDVFQQQQNIQELILTIGGSATNDMGLGFLQALGVKLIKNDGQIFNDIFVPQYYQLINNIDRSGLILPNNVQIVVLCDVTNPLTGINGASYVYGPQKGLQKQDILICDQNMERISRNISENNQFPGDGAAGGMGFILRTVLNAKVVSGAEYILNKQKFHERTKGFDLLITGEGKYDHQSKCGKAVHVACQQFQGKCKCGIFGVIDSLTADNSLFDAIFNINQGDEDSKLTQLSRTKENIVKTCKSIISLVRTIQIK